MLDVHPASAAEREEAFRNVFDVWPMAETVEEHLQRRLASRQHARAAWYVGCLEGRVVCSLGCYPITFRVRGDLVPGMAIGAVHTAAAFQRRGFARRLIEEVEAAQNAEGTRLSLLFSDIDPAYYARLGYVRCPAFEFTEELPEGRPEDSMEIQHGRLCPMEGSPSPAALEEYRSGSVRETPISIHRDDEYWAFLFEKEADDRHFWYENVSGVRTGFVRLGMQGDTARLRDWSLAETGRAARASFLEAVCRGAQAIGARNLSGWLPHFTLAHHRFAARPRLREITMLKSLEGGPSLTADLVDAAGRFAEIDHI